MKQEQRQKTVAKKPQEAHDGPQKDVRNEDLAEAVDGALEAIEEVLEDQFDAELLADLDDILGDDEEARQMVDNFVQQGGE